MIIREFKAQDLLLLQAQRWQANSGIEISLQYCLQLEAHSKAFTGIVDNRIIGCAGISEQWKGRVIAWAWFSGGIGTHFISVHRAVKSFLDAQSYRRIEAYTHCDFNEANRWMRMLGFEKEGKMSKFLPCGSDAYMWVRLR